MRAWWKRRGTTGGTTSVFIDADGFSLAHVRLTSEGVRRLEICLVEEGLAPDALPSRLAAVVRAQGLAGTPCVAVLRPEVYSLRQIEAPAVEPAELVEAARWSIKDLVDFPVADAAVDIFDVPMPDPERNRRIYVVAAPRSVVEEVVETVLGSGLDLKVIDVTELALRNVASLLCEPESSLGLVWFRAGVAVLTISRGGELYLARRLQSEPDLLLETAAYQGAEDKVELSDEALSVLESVVLETQRSLDYYEHQLKQGAVSSILLNPLDGPTEPLGRYLSDRLAVDVSVLAAGSLLPMPDGLAASLRGSSLPAIGGALRPLDSGAGAR